MRIPGFLRSRYSREADVLRGWLSLTLDIDTEGLSDVEAHAFYEMDQAAASAGLTSSERRAGLLGAIKATTTEARK